MSPREPQLVAHAVVLLIVGAVFGFWAHAEHVVGSHGPLMWDYTDAVVYLGLFYAFVASLIVLWRRTSTWRSVILAHVVALAILVALALLLVGAMSLS